MQPAYTLTAAIVCAVALAACKEAPTPNEKTAMTTTATPAATPEPTSAPVSRPLRAPRPAMRRLRRATRLRPQPAIRILSNPLAATRQRLRRHSRQPGDQSDGNPHQGRRTERNALGGTRQQSPSPSLEQKQQLGEKRPLSPEVNRENLRVNAHEPTVTAAAPAAAFWAVKRWSTAVPVSLRRRMNRLLGERRRSPRASSRGLETSGPARNGDVLSYWPRPSASNTAKRNHERLAKRECMCVYRTRWALRFSTQAILRL
jgi:hypothetical protein